MSISWHPFFLQGIGQSSAAPDTGFVGSDTTATLGLLLAVPGDSHSLRLYES